MLNKHSKFNFYHDVLTPYAEFQPEGFIYQIITGLKPDQKLRITYTRRGGPISAEWEGVVYTNFSRIPYFNMINNAIYHLMVDLVGDLERFFGCLPTAEDLKTILEAAATRNLEQGFLRKELASIVGVRTVRVLTHTDFIQASIHASFAGTGLVMAFDPEQAMMSLGLNLLNVACVPFITRSPFSGLGTKIIEAAALTMLDEVNRKTLEAFGCRALTWEKAIASHLRPATEVANPATEGTGSGAEPVPGSSDGAT